jgi:hypothetical protein
VTTRNTKMHGGHNALNYATLGWFGHWSKELRRRRKRGKVAKASRKVNRG